MAVRAEYFVQIYASTMSHACVHAELAYITMFCFALLCLLCVALPALLACLLCLLCFALLCFACFSCFALLGLLCFVLLCSALLCFALLCFALLCFALPALLACLLRFALLCFALLCIALLALRHLPNIVFETSRASREPLKPLTRFCTFEKDPLRHLGENLSGISGTPKTSQRFLQV